MSTYSVITGTGSYLPEKIVKNEDFLSNEFFDSNGDKITTPTTQIIEKFKEMVESGMTSEKIAKAFNLETLKTMAASFDIEVTDEDTKLSIVEALMEEDEEPSED